MHIYMTRHGESTNNIKNIIGGDTNLSNSGKKYGIFLKKYFSSTSLDIWTSTLKRTIETASYLNHPYKTYENLNEIDAGDFDNLVLNNIKLDFPKVYNTRNNDKLNNSYPHGENYLNLQLRVIPILNQINMKKDTTLLIISHKAVCRVIYSYFTNTPLSECTNIEIYLHSLYKLEDNKFTQIK